ncbi:MAG: ribonuclease P protein component [Chitinivibrionales bacterium]|nr:ribonuclease P protein component [Chitinivibrionales bacterium]
MNEYFGKHLRLCQKNDIRNVLKSGRKARLGFFIVSCVPNSFQFDRYGIILSRKHGNAVRRNRIKRIYREILRKNKIMQAPYFDILIRPLYGKKIEYRCILKEYSEWLKKLKERNQANMKGYSTSE